MLEETITIRSLRVEREGLTWNKYPILSAMESFSDEALVERFQATGEQRYVNELFGRYYARVSAWCYRISGNRESAADLAQEVFIKIYRSLYSFRGNSKFGTWVYSIARNHCFSEARAKAARPIEEGGESLASLAATQSDVQDSLERDSAEKLMQEFVHRALNPVEKQVVLLHYVDELPLDTVTRLLELKNQSGAKAFIVSARRKLKAEFEKWNACASQGGESR